VGFHESNACIVDLVTAPFTMKYQDCGPNFQCPTKTTVKSSHKVEHPLILLYIVFPKLPPVVLQEYGLFAVVLKRWDVNEWSCAGMVACA